MKSSRMNACTRQEATSCFLWCRRAITLLDLRQVVVQGDHLVHLCCIKEAGDACAHRMLPKSVSPAPLIFHASSHIRAGRHSPDWPCWPCITMSGTSVCCFPMDSPAIMPDCLMAHGENSPWEALTANDSKQVHKGQEHGVLKAALCEHTQTIFHCIPMMGKSTEQVCVMGEQWSPYLGIFLVVQLLSRHNLFFSYIPY